MQFVEGEVNSKEVLLGLLKVARGSLLVAWRKSLVPALTEIPGGGQKSTTKKDLKNKASVNKKKFINYSHLKHVSETACLVSAIRL